MLVVFVKVVEPWLCSSQDVVRLEADHIMQESSELVNFALHLDVGPRIFLEERGVLVDFSLERLQLLLVDF